MRKRALPHTSEESVQRTIIDGLRVHAGLTVLQTSHRVKQHRKCRSCGTVTQLKPACGKCGSWLPMGNGVDPGVPDLLVTRRSWPVGVWIGLEVKGPGTRLSPEQALLLADGRIYVVRSWEDACAALLAAERALGAGGER